MNIAKNYYKLKTNNQKLKLKQLDKIPTLKGYQSYYQEKYGIQVLSQSNYNKKDEEEQEDERKQLQSFLEAILEQEKQKDYSKIISLENIIKQKGKEEYITQINSNRTKKINKYITHLNALSSSHHINSESGAHVFYVPSSALPPNVLGMYVPSEHTFYVANDLSPKQMQWVYYHEEYHARYGAGEAQADDYATGKLGYNPFGPRQYALAA